MSNELFLEVSHIRIRIKNIIANKTDKTRILIESFAIKNKNKITYRYEDTSYNIILGEEIFLIRETKDYIHKFIFKLDNITKSEYYIKELNTSIDVMIKTTKLTKKDSKIEIDYEIIDTNTKYSFILDME